jgi:hypothetical protein
MTGNSARIMRKVIQTELMEEYYKQKSGDVYNKVQWEVFQKALKQKKATDHEVNCHGSFTDDTGRSIKLVINVQGSNQE